MPTLRTEALSTAARQAKAASLFFSHGDIGINTHSQCKSVPVLKCMKHAEDMFCNLLDAKREVNTTAALCKIARHCSADLNVTPAHIHAHLIQYSEPVRAITANHSTCTCSRNKCSTSKSRSSSVWQNFTSMHLMMCPIHQTGSMSVSSFSTCPSCCITLSQG